MSSIFGHNRAKLISVSLIATAGLSILMLYQNYAPSIVPQELSSTCSGQTAKVFINDNMFVFESLSVQGMPLELALNQDHVFKFSGFGEGNADQVSCSTSTSVKWTMPNNTVIENTCMTANFPAAGDFAIILNAIEGCENQQLIQKTIYLRAK